MEFIKQFAAARRVSTPLVNIRTFDAKSTTTGVINFLTGEKDYGISETPLLVWDSMHGLAALNGTEISKKAIVLAYAGADPQMTIPIAETLRLLENDEIQDAIIFIANAHLHWATDPNHIQGIWNLRNPFKSNGNTLVLLSSPGAKLPDELTSDVLVLEEPLPTLPELKQFVLDTYKYAKIPESQYPSDAVIARAQDALIGLPAFPAEQAIAMCLELERGDKKDSKKVTGGTLDTKELWERKRGIINQTPGLTINKSSMTLDDIGGLDSVKVYMKAVMEGRNPPKVILFMDEIEKALAGTGTDMSGTKTELAGSLLTWMQEKGVRGVIFNGIPGVSKSALSKGLGGTYQKPVINFDIAAMQNSLVGASGSQMRGAQKVAEAVAGNMEGSILAIATCNGMGALSPEMLRRFNLGIFFFDAPTRDEKDVIWKIHRAKNHIVESDVNAPDKGWTGAEIEQCCIKAYELNWTLLQASKYIVPVTQSAPDVIAATRAGANGKYLSASRDGVYQMTETQEVLKTNLAPVYTADRVEGRRIRD